MASGVRPRASPLAVPQSFNKRARSRTRTGDPFLTIDAGGGRQGSRSP
jgi:hypothetical protein